MLLGTEGKIVFDFAGNGARSDVDRGVGGKCDVDIAGVRGELVVSVIGEHSGIGDDSVRSVDFDVGPANVFEIHGA